MVNHSGRLAKVLVKLTKRLVNLFHRLRRALVNQSNDSGQPGQPRSRGRGRERAVVQQSVCAQCLPRRAGEAVQDWHSRGTAGTAQQKGGSVRMLRVRDLVWGRLGPREVGGRLRDIMLVEQVPGRRPPLVCAGEGASVCECLVAGITLKEASCRSSWKPVPGRFSVEP